MKKQMTLMMALFLFISVAAIAKDGISGKWKGTADGPQGKMEMKFDFKADGGELTGTFEGPMGSMEIKNGIIEGNKFSFDIALEDFTIKHDCEVISKDEILMKTEMFEISLKRDKD